MWYVIDYVRIHFRVNSELFSVRSIVLFSHCIDIWDG